MTADRLSLRNAEEPWLHSVGEFDEGPQGLHEAIAFPGAHRRRDPSLELREATLQLMEQRSAGLGQVDAAAPAVVGIRPADSEKGDQKRVLTPAAAIVAGADYLVVGRPIVAAPDPKAAAEAIIAEMAAAVLKAQ